MKPSKLLSILAIPFLLNSCSPKEEIKIYNEENSIRIDSIINEKIKQSKGDTSLALEKYTQENQATYNAFKELIKDERIYNTFLINCNKNASLERKFKITIQNTEEKERALELEIMRKYEKNLVNPPEIPQIPLLPLYLENWKER